jgi:hypothetical protein
MQNIDADALLNAIAAQLDAIARQLDAGFDVAPAQRLALEGLTAASLAAGIEVEVLLQYCRRSMPKGSDMRLSANGDALQFDFWQRRAPVYPTTTD